MADKLIIGEGNIGSGLTLDSSTKKVNVDTTTIATKQDVVSKQEQIYLKNTKVLTVPLLDNNDNDVLPSTPLDGILDETSNKIVYLHVPQNNVLVFKGLSNTSWYLHGNTITGTFTDDQTQYSYTVAEDPNVTNKFILTITGGSYTNQQFHTGTPTVSSNVATILPFVINIVTKDGNREAVTSAAVANALDTKQDVLSTQTPISSLGLYKITTNTYGQVTSSEAVAVDTTTALTFNSNTIAIKLASASDFGVVKIDTENSFLEINNGVLTAPRSIACPYPLHIADISFDGSVEKWVYVDTEAIENSTSLVRSGGVYNQLYHLADEATMNALVNAKNAEVTARLTQLVVGPLLKIT